MEFKVGDWVRSNVFGIGKIDSLHKGCTTTVRVKGWYTRDTIDNTRNYDINIQHCELWKPKVGEYCWFLTCNSGYELGQFVEILSNGKFRYRLNSTNSLFNCSHCEPFIGTLPSFIKEL